MPKLREILPTIQLNANHLVVYSHPIYEETKSEHKNGKNDNLTRGVFKGEMSIKTRKEIKSKLMNYFNGIMYMGAKFRNAKKIRPIIITLTLPATQRHTDNEIKRECLMRFLELLKAKYKVVFYYWVAEKQQNGNIHFHILTDRFVNWQWIRKAWNTRLETLGYISEFKAKHGHDNPNSTDVEDIRSLSKSAVYVTKYTTKIDQQGKIQGRLHGECDLLKLCAKVSTKMRDEFQKQLDYLVQYNALEEIANDYSRVYISTNKTPLQDILKTHAPYLHNYFTDAVKGQVCAMYATN